MKIKQTIKKIEEEIEKAKSVKYRICLVCEKSYPIRQSDTKRYCSKECSNIAMRVRDWENKRGMNLRVLKAKLSGSKLALKDVLSEIDVFKKGINRFGFTTNKKKNELIRRQVLEILDDELIKPIQEVLK